MRYSYTAIGTAMVLIHGAMAQAQVASEASAQSSIAPSQSVAASDSGGLAGDIIVTARRREEALSRVPITVSALSNESLREKSIRSLDQLQQSVPGLTISSAGGSSNPTINIRGQDRPNLGEAAPPVVTYFADVPMNYIASIVPTYDLASVQVLKGPQGTLFGRNTTGGAVLIYPVAPNFETGGYISAGYGNYNKIEAEGAVNLPIVDEHIALRIAGQRIKRDGYVKMATGGDREDINDTSFRVSLLLQANDDLKNVTIYDDVAWHRSGDGPILTHVYGGPIALRSAALAPYYDCNVSITCDIDLAFARQQAAGVRKNWGEKHSYLRTRATGLSNTTTWNIGDITLKNIFGYRTAKTDNLAETDGVDLTLITAVNRAMLRQYTEEFQIQGSFLDDKLQTILGAFYLKSEPNGPSGLALGTFSPPSRPSMILSYRTQVSKAIFGAITYDFSGLVEGLKLDAGLRRTQDKTDSCSVGYPAIIPFDFGTPLATEDQCENGGSVVVNNTAYSTLGTQVSSKSKAWTWNIGLNYQATSDIFLYATTRHGYRAGGVNTPLFSTTAPRSLAQFQSYSPETVQDFELGAKVAWRTGAIHGNFNIDVFRAKYKNTQRNVNGLANFDLDGDTSNDPSAGSIVINAGTSRVQGIDFDTNIYFNRNLSINAFASYNDHKYLTLGTPDILASTTAFPSTAEATAFRYAPKLTLGGGVRYEARLGEDVGNLVMNVDAYRSSRIYFGSFKDDLNLSQSAYALVNARIDWQKLMGTSVTASLYMRNIFNKTYANGAANSASSAGFASLLFAEPRMYGVQMRIEF